MTEFGKAVWKEQMSPAVVMTDGWGLLRRTHPLIMALTLGEKKVAGL